MSSADAVRAPSTGIKKSSSCSSLESISSSTKALSQEDIVNLALSLDLNSPSLDAKKPFSSSSKSSGDDSVFIFSGIKKSSSCSSLESMSPSTKALSQEDIVNLALSLNLNSPSLDAKKPFSSSSESSGDDSGTNSESSYSGHVMCCAFTVALNSLLEISTESVSREKDNDWQRDLRGNPCGSKVKDNANRTSETTT